MLSDPIADLLARIKNANMRKIKKIELPYSKMKESILKVLKSEGFITDFKVFKEKNKSYKSLSVLLNYDNDKEITNLARISKPSLRVYKKYDELKPFMNGVGTYIISTSQGVMSDLEAKKRKLGGEVVCSVY